MDGTEEFLERAEREIMREQSRAGTSTAFRPGFRLGVDPHGTVQPCTYCGAPGYWSNAGFQGVYTAPPGHTLRVDGTLGCPRSRGDRFKDAPYWRWREGEATEFFTDSTEFERWQPTE